MFRKLAAVAVTAASLALTLTPAAHAADGTTWESPWLKKVYELGYQPVPDPPYDPVTVTPEVPWVGYDPGAGCDLFGVRPNPSGKVAAQQTYTEYDRVPYSTDGTVAWKVVDKLTDPVHTRFVDPLPAGWVRSGDIDPGTIYFYAVYKGSC